MKGNTMTTVIKRSISLLLVLLLVVSMLPSVYAAETTEETTGTEPEETRMPPPDETEPTETSQPPATEAPGPFLSEDEIIDDSEPPIMFFIEGDIALASIPDCQAATWATIWVNTDEYSPVVGKTNRFIYYDFAGKARNRNNVGLKAIKVNGTWQAAYCIEPGIAEGSTYTEEDMTMDEFVGSSAAPSTLTEQQLKAMCVAVMYGQRTLPQSDSYELLSNMVATQIIVWEIAIGWRNATPPYAQTNDAFIRRFENAYGKGPEATSMYITVGGRLQNVISAYNQISASMASHSDAIPSFTSASQSNAPTIELKPNGNGQYTATVTDSNRVLSGYSFPKVSGLTFSTSGNTLTITSDRPMDSTLVAPTQNRVNLQGHPFFVWYNGSYQVMLGSQADPSYKNLPVYFRVRAVDPTGSMKLTKTTEDGNNLSGWQFGIYSNSACTTLVEGPYTTDSSGKISVAGLTAGTYYVKELGHTNSSLNALYYCSSTNPQKVTITAGSTASVSFTNKLCTGSLNLTKTTEDGKNLSGWKFSIYSNSTCTTLVSGPHTTNSSGKISVTGLKPGTYYVKELGHTDSSINVLYYCVSTNPQKITITANGIASVSFSNKLNTGNLNLTKTTEDGNNLSGWQFSIYSDSACATLVSGPHATDSSGKITVSGLKPGTYYVKEIGHTDTAIHALYTCASTNPQKVTITSNATANVSFHNKLNTGSVILKKQTNTGENLSGWQIGLYTDAVCTKAISGSPFTTGEDGSITVSELPVGTLYVKEVPIDDPYWVCDSEVKTITIEAGKTATVTFLNTHYGNIRITKNAVNGSAEGWSFQILDADRNAVDTVKSRADGFAYSDMLLPGQYFIREVHDRDDTYWEYDVVAEKEVTVTAGSQAEVSYTNTQYGKLQIQKSTSDGSSLDGWQFRITDASGKEIEGSPFTTNASGLILTGKLQPGEYTVKEIIPEDSFYYCTSENPQIITVKAGETAQVSFTNAMRYGQITIEKVDSRGESLAGAKFMLQWSEDGSLWWPIEYSDTLGEGKCSNSNIEDGCLTSGKDGLLEWTDLHPGLHYRVTELEAPKGYTLLSKPAFEGKLPSEELTVSLRVVNCEIFALPQTGSSAVAFFRISQLLCICVCSILLIHSYRKERKK